MGGPFLFKVCPLISKSIARYSRLLPNWAFPVSVRAIKIRAAKGSPDSDILLVLSSADCPGAFQSYWTRQHKCSDAII